MRLRQSFLFCLLSIFITFSQASAWGPDGHHTVGAIADQLLIGTHAADEVQAILGNVTLQDAAVWADCAKGIDPKKNYAYTSEGRYPECEIFETPEEEAAMADFVRRNDTNCNPQPDGKACHNEYHYTDVAIQHDHYDRNYVGTRNDDIVAAIIAATHVLKGDPSPAPFNFKDKREALLLLTHYVGDIHQPLHVGALYLDANGHRVNPDSGTYKPETDTHGGNSLMISSRNMHSKWDAVPALLRPSHVDDFIDDAEAVPVTVGQIYDWPANWATETIGAAKKAFIGLKFSSKTNSTWVATLPPKYSSKMNGIKKTQIIRAGAHLAQLFEAIWP